MTNYEKAVGMLNQLEDILIRLDTGHGNVTRQIQMAGLRALYFMFLLWVKEHEPKEGAEGDN